MGVPEGVPVGLPEGVPVKFSEGVEPTTQGPTTYSPAKQYNNPKDALKPITFLPIHLPLVLKDKTFAHGRTGRPRSELLQRTMNHTSSTFY